MKSGISCKWTKWPVLSLLVLLVAASCTQREPARTEQRMSEKDKEEMLLRINKFLVQKDIELIESYAARRGWNMNVSETGLFYEIYEKTNGKKVEEGKEIRINYEISLLDGSACYNSKEDGPKVFTPGRSDEISGLEQGVLMMREGEKARFIIPPHLGYGLLGDERKIPARAIVVYLVELEQVRD